MAYGILKVDTVTFTDAGIDKSVTLSGLVQNPTFSGNVTVTGTLSGVTVTGTTANFTSGNFTNISGGTHTITSGVFAAGSAASPSITFTGDLNTGIYSPGADQVSVTTGGTERLRVDATGQIEVVSLGTAAAPAFSFTTDPNTGIYSPGADQVAISTNSSGRLFIDANGNVGINTASTIAPGGFGYAREFALTGATSGDSSAAINIRGSRTVSGGFGDINFWHQSTSNRAYIQARRGSSDSAIDLDFITSGGAGMRITSAGLVGVGTSSPSVLLDVYGTGSVLGKFVRNNTGGASGGVTIGNNDRTYTLFGDSSIFQLYDNTAATTRVAVDTSGRLGVGITSVSASRQVEILQPSGYDSGLRIRAGGSGSYHEYFSGVANWKIGCPQDTNALQFLNDGSERARIDSSGRLLVGTSSTSDACTQVLQGYYPGGSAEEAILKLQRGTASPTTSATLGLIQFASSTGRRGAEIYSQRDGGTWTDGSSHPGRLVFSTTADGASSPTERMRLINSGFLKVSNDGSYQSTTSGNHEFTNTLDSDSLVVRSTNASYSGNGILALATRNTTNNSFYAFSYYNSGASAYRFRIADSGNATNTNNSYGAISDAKLKENIVDATSQWSDIKALQVRKYNFKKETGQQTHTQIGLIAQEVELVSPGLVSESPDRDAEGNDLGTVTKSVNYSVLYMKAVKALQEAMERIETLEAKVAALESA